MIADIYRGEDVSSTERNYTNNESYLFTILKSRRTRGSILPKSFTLNEILWVWTISPPKKMINGGLVSHGYQSDSWSVEKRKSINAIFLLKIEELSLLMIFVYTNIPVLY